MSLVISLAVIHCRLPVGLKWPSWVTTTECPPSLPPNFALAFRLDEAFIFHMKATMSFRQNDIFRFGMIIRVLGRDSIMQHAEIRGRMLFFVDKGTHVFNKR